jgi:nitroimidazol reductase NimA-like FMN-containing flavoprotein (pyridoxamine 5'-phosphate oxidase superfamily)
MRLADREVRDKVLIRAMLDICDVINIAFFDQEYPYNLPVNFGYEYEDDLIFYCHHGPEGYKNHLIEEYPKVCVVTHRFLDKIYNSYDKSSHDYRSVMAFGEISFIDPNSDEYKKAWERLCACNGRTVPDMVYQDDFRHHVKMSKIVCRPENVVGKAQRHITSVAQIPLQSDPHPGE